MRGMLIWCVLVGAVRGAAAEPVVVEPAPYGGTLVPVTMAELHARSRLELSFGVATIQLLAYAATVEIGGGYALGGGFEAFGRVPVVALGEVAIGGDGNNDVALGNIVVGARHVTERRAGPQRYAIAPALWTWLPTAGADDFEVELSDLFGLEDARAFLPTLALGASISASARGRAGFVQVELGAALVEDGGPQIDNIFGAIGAGVRLNDCTGLLAEWRLEAFPPAGAQASSSRLQALSIGIGRPTWKARFHPMFGSEHGIEGLAFVAEIHNPL